MLLPRVQSTIIAMVISAPVTALYQMCTSDGTHDLAPIDAVVCPEARDTSPTTLLIRKNKGEPRQRDRRLTKRYAWVYCFQRRCLVFTGLFVKILLIFVSMLLSRVSLRVRAG